MVQVNALGLVTLNTIESVVLNGLGGNDQLTVTTPAGVNTITYTPGTTVDAARVQVNSLVPMRFLNLGTGGSVTLDDPADGRVDTLIYNGTRANDTFNVAATSGAITLNSQLVVNTPGVANLTLNGLTGDDTFNVFAVQPAARSTTSGSRTSTSLVAAASIR
jgi:hypothetical protein